MTFFVIACTIHASLLFKETSNALQVESRGSIGPLASWTGILQATNSVVRKRPHNEPTQFNEHSKRARSGPSSSNVQGDGKGALENDNALTEHVQPQSRKTYRQRNIAKATKRRVALASCSIESSVQASTTESTSKAGQGSRIVDTDYFLEQLGQVQHKRECRQANMKVVDECFHGAWLPVAQDPV